MPKDFDYTDEELGIEKTTPEINVSYSRTKIRLHKNRIQWCRKGSSNWNYLPADEEADFMAMASLINYKQLEQIKRLYILAQTYHDQADTAWKELGRLRKAIRQSFPDQKFDGCNAPDVLTSEIDSLRERLVEAEIKIVLYQKAAKESREY